MENFSYSSYGDSGDSSPRSREIDVENQSWDEQQPPPQSVHSTPAAPAASSYKVKFMCSYGGKIQPRPHDNQLAYIGGDTKILAVDRNIKFAAMMTKLSSLCGDSDVCFKYQLPGEDLDALISVTNDEDLEHMMMEYDRLYRASVKPARLRLFLFPLNPGVVPFGSNEPKSDRQWFVDALNSVPIPTLEDSSPPAVKAATANPDFLFGLDKGFVPNAAKMADPTSASELVAKDFSAAGSDCGSEDRHVIGDPSVVSPAEIQRQIQELQRLQIAAAAAAAGGGGVGGVGGIEQGGVQRKADEGNQRVYGESYYKVPEKVTSAPAPVQVPIPAAYLQERHMASAGYPMGVAASAGTEQPVYLIPAPGAGVYHSPALRPVAGPGGQAYYGVYNAAPQAAPAAGIPQPKFVGGYGDGIGIPQQHPKAGVTAEPGYVQVAYDGAGRQVYYTTAPGGALPQYQAVAVDGRQVVGGGGGNGGALNQEGKGVVNAKTPQTSCV